MRTIRNVNVHEYPPSYQRGRHLARKYSESIIDKLELDSSLGQKSHPKSGSQPATHILAQCHDSHLGFEQWRIEPGTAHFYLVPDTALCHTADLLATLLADIMPTNYINIAKTACLPCEKGQFQNLPSESNCKPCVPGKFNFEKGLSTCKDCGIGKYNDKSGQTAEINCTECTIGKFNNNAPIGGTATYKQSGVPFKSDCPIRGTIIREITWGVYGDDGKALVLGAAGQTAEVWEGLAVLTYRLPEEAMHQQKDQTHLDASHMIRPR
jgi:hypothetical protein